MLLFCPSFVLRQALPLIARTYFSSEHSQLFAYEKPICKSVCFSNDKWTDFKIYLLKAILFFIDFHCFIKIIVQKPVETQANWTVVCFSPRHRVENWASRASSYCECTTTGLIRKKQLAVAFCLLPLFGPNTSAHVGQYGTHRPSSFPKITWFAFLEIIHRFLAIMHL